MFPGIEYIKTALNAIMLRFRDIQAHVDTVQANVDTVQANVDTALEKQPDFEEHDSESHAYIKNKPFYDYIEPNVVIWESDSAGTSYRSVLTLVSDMGDGYLIEGSEYTLTVNGVSSVYTCQADADGYAGIGSGNSHLSPRIFQNDYRLSAWTDTLWKDGDTVKLEGPLRRYKKLDSGFYDAPKVNSVNGNQGDVTITASSLNAASYRTDGGKTRVNAEEGVYFYKNASRTLTYLGDGVFEFSTGNASGSGVKLYNNRIKNIHVVEDEYDVANKKYVDYVKDTISSSAIPVPSTASAGQALVVKSVDEDGKPTEWAAADMAGVGGGSEWTKLGDITVNESYEFIPLSFTAGVVTIDTSAEGYEYLTSNARVNCVVVPINIMTKVGNNIVGQLRVTDATAGTFDFYNRDGEAQTSASYDPATYKIVVLNVVDVVMENVPTTYDRYKLRVTTPVISTHGVRSFFHSTIRGLGLDASAVINSSGGGFVEIELLTIPGNTNYMYRSVYIAYGKLYGGGSSNEFQAFDIVQAGTGLTKPPANGTVTFTATSMIFVNGTRFELWGANDD